MDMVKLQAIFADRLFGLMVEKGYNQSQLAKAANLKVNTLSNWLNCKRAPQIDSIYKIAEFFNVSSDYLLGLED